MDICGNICVDRTSEAYILQCTFCAKEVDIKLWQEFVHHIQTLHNSTDHHDPLVVKIENIKMETRSMAKCLEENEFIDISVKDEEIIDDSPDSLKSFGSNKSDVPEDSEVSLEISDSESIEKLETITKLNPSFYRRNPRTDIFIETFKNLQCLWNPADNNFKNMDERSKAIQKLISEMEKCANVILTERSVNVAIKRLQTQFISVCDMKKKATQKISSVVLEYFEKCSFLGDVLDIQDNNSDDEIDKSKSLVLTKVNKITSSFIEAYERCPQLYDPNHKDYTNLTVRKNAYVEMSDLLKNQNINLTDDEVFQTIQNLRIWYYKASERCKDDLSDLPVGQQFYVEKCSFLPPKMLQQKLPCEKCDKIFFTETTLQVHLYKDHNIGGLPYKCSQCERSFEQKSQLTVHQQRTHIGKVHQCEYCERRFAVHSDLKLHIRTHTGHKPYVCELCGKAFRVRTQLGYHVNAIHTKNRAFKCTMCPKDFLKNRDLKDHIKAHLNIRDKICETCGKGFTNCHSLIRHRQIHAEVKKFACKLCDAKFFQFVGLNSHLKRTHNIVKSKTLE